MRHAFVLTSLIMVIACAGNAQSSATRDTSIEKAAKNARFFILPLISYSPETSFRLGAAGIFLFRGKQAGANTLLSSIKVPVSYTLNNQPKARVSFEIFTNENKHIFTGSTQWQRFPLFFYGIGPDTKEEDEELYTSRSYGAELSYLKKVAEKIYFGGRMEWINNKITEKEEGGILSEEGLVPGNNGGTILGLGVVFRYDRRDNNFNATSGPFIESGLSTFQESLGSDFSFTKFTLDCRHFIRAFQHHVLAIQFYTQVNWGNPPFESMALLGNDEIMRGHYEGRFRDKGYWAGQVEYRLPLGRKDWSPDTSSGKLSFWQRWGLVGFAGLGTVGADASTMWTNPLKYSIGLGIRFLLLPKEKVNFRVDFGFGTQNPGFYLNVREAF